MLAADPAYRYNRSLEDGPLRCRIYHSKFGFVEARTALGLHMRFAAQDRRCSGPVTFPVTSTMIGTARYGARGYDF